MIRFGDVALRTIPGRTARSLNDFFAELGR